jgi:polyphosphate:AMP phosphotransferase
MLKDIDLARKMSKSEFRAAEETLTIALGVLQRRASELRVPWIVVFEGWSAAGKGTLINNLILPLDPRGFRVYSRLGTTEEDTFRPFLWKFWVKTPERGRLAVFDRSWYRRVVDLHVETGKATAELRQAYGDIVSFERQLADDGNVIVKFFLHVSREEQRRRLERLRRNPVTAWRVTAEDMAQNKRYKAYRAAVDETLAATDSDFAPWTVVESEDERFATLKIFNTVANALECGIARAENRQAAERGTRKAGGEGAKASAGRPSRRSRTPGEEVMDRLNASVIDRLDLSLALEEAAYRKGLKAKQRQIRDLEHAIYTRRIPVVIVFEGCDAAGKGGCIRRLTQRLDPRGYEVVPVGAPNDLEKAHHYLWRFWTQIPKAGHITIFDRSWYGRVLVERVEGFCGEDEWRRAFREINEMERHMANFGAIVIKFWLHVSPEEQLRRFRERERIAHKRWKITEEDWRNREKWDSYKLAIEEMLCRTSTPSAAWVVVESNCKWYARIKVLDTVIRAIEKRVE